MIVLLDTSTADCRLSVLDGGSWQNYEWQAGRTLARGLIGFIEDKVGDLKSIQAIGVMKGPGSFTGLRIGITVANTLADSLNIPIVGEVGENWQDLALARLESGDNDKVVLPNYGSPAHITHPRK